MNRNYTKISGRVQVSNESGLMPVEFSTMGDRVDNMIFMRHGRKIEVRNLSRRWTCSDNVLANSALGVSQEYKCVLSLTEQDYRQYQL